MDELHDSIKNICKLLNFSEEKLLEWFTNQNELIDLKNLNYAIMCIKKIAETYKIISINELKYPEREDYNDKGEYMEGLSKTISKLLRESQDEEGED